MKTLNNVYCFESSDVAKFRLQVLDHYYKYGWESTVDAFKIGKSTLYDWKKAFEKSTKRLSSLVPSSTVPKRVRVMRVDQRVLDLIVSLRDKEYRMSKYQIKPFVDALCKELRIDVIGLTTVGKIIKRNNLFPKGKKKVKTNRKDKNFLKKAPKETTPGYIQTDSIHVWIMNRKYYFITVIDVVTKYACCHLTTWLSSRQAMQALKEFQDSYRYPLRVIQTDNGSEFLGEFDQYLQQQKIIHEFIYPRSPKINGVVERFNRTFKEEFLNYNDEFTHDTTLFSQKLHRYLDWYNTKRPHQTLKFQAPLEYLKQISP